MELLGWVTASLFAPPGEAFFRELSAGTLEEALEELTGHPVALPQVAPSELQAAYTALFVSNPSGLPAPPYAGYALDGELFGPSYHRLLELYREGGLEVQETWRPDLSRRLVQEFLHPWLKRFGPAVKAHDPTGFYRELVELLEEAIHAKTGVSEA